ncbi:MAG: HAD family phosphatase [Kiritimatiellales bacterium]
MISAVIFDFDGVIVDSERLHWQAFNMVMKPRGKEISWDDYVNVYIGFDDRDAFRRTFPGISASELDQLIAEKAGLFQTLVQHSGADPLPGSVELINHLSGRLPVAICSGARKTDIEPVLRKLGIADAFDVIVTSEDTHVSKPDPAPYRKAWEILSRKFPALTTPAQAVAIEDTPAGIQSAQGAGLRTLAVTNSYPPELLVTFADAVTNSLEGLTLEELNRVIA